ncbi:MAG: potassium channel protein [Ignavibacteria bacterium]|nr:potassium channel protein [Ignavibacteria bacterium]
MDSNIKKKLVLTGVALLIVFSIGTFGYYLITDFKYDLFTCFYMTVITVTTIGFDEIIDLKDFEGGRPFTVFLAFAGIGILTYFVSTISAVIIEGQLKESYKKRIMEKAINKFTDHYIVCGVGNNSFHLIDELNVTKRESVCVEINPDALRDILDKYPNQKYIVGDATHAEVLTKAGIEKAKGLFATTNDDNKNLVISLLGRKMSPDIRIISRCTNHENQYKIKLAGADDVISPNYMGGLRMASEMLRPVVTHFLDIMLSDTYKNLRLEQITIKGTLSGQMIGELKLDEFKDTIFIALKSGEDLIFKPDDSYKVKDGDLLLIITTPDERIKLESLNL